MRKTLNEYINIIKDLIGLEDALKDNKNAETVNMNSINLGIGSAEYSLSVKRELFYSVITENTNLKIKDDKDLMETLSELAVIKEEYMRVKNALDELEATGYGIVMPTLDELTLEEPKIIKQNGKYGVKLKASAPSIHMMKINTTAEVTPIVGSEQQSEELVTYLLKEFEESPQKIWESNIFGKSVNELVNEGLNNKLYRMPQQARTKVGETIEKIINDGCNGLICIIL